MACAIQAAPGHAQANSYGSAEDADAYFAARLHATEWIQLTENDKCRALVWATALLDDWVVWAGRASTYTQRLAWPRWGLLTITEDVVPQDVVPDGVKAAVCELAWSLRTEDKTRTPDQVAAGLSSLTAGPVTLAFFGPTAGGQTDGERIMAPNVLGPIRRWVVTVQGGGFASVPVGRS